MVTADPKTPEEYIAALDEPRRSQIEQLHGIIRQTVPKLDPHIRSGMIGYGTYHYKYQSGREGEWFVIGLASNKRYISLYIMGADGNDYIAGRYQKRLPKADIGKSCVRIKKLDDVDLGVVAQMVEESARSMGAEV